MESTVCTHTDTYTIIDAHKHWQTNLPSRSSRDVPPHGTDTWIRYKHTKYLHTVQIHTNNILPSRSSRDAPIRYRYMNTHTHKPSIRYRCTHTIPCPQGALETHLHQLTRRERQAARKGVRERERAKERKRTSKCERGRWLPCPQSRSSKEAPPLIWHEKRERAREREIERGREREGASERKDRER